MQDRLYIVTRADLPAGLQAAQVAHAAFQFSAEHPQHTADWLESSNYLIVVSVADEYELLGVVEQARKQGIDITAVREPDIEDQLTAVALTPGSLSRAMCASMPLALREPVMSG